MDKFNNHQLMLSNIKVENMISIRKGNTFFKYKFFLVNISIFADVYQISVNKNLSLQMPNGYSLQKIQGLNFVEVKYKFDTFSLFYFFLMKDS